MKMTIVAAGVALALGILLACKSPPVTRGMYRVGYFLGVAALAAIFLSPSGSFQAHLGLGARAYVAVVLFVLVAQAPIFLIIEIGIAGYRGFSSWARCISLSVPAAIVALLVFARLRYK